MYRVDSNHFMKLAAFFILDTMALDHSNSSIWWDYKGGYNGIWCQRAFCWRWHLHCHGLNAWPAKMSRIRARDQNDIVSSYSPTRRLSSLYCHKANTYYHIADLHKKYSLIHLKRYLDGKLNIVRCTIFTSREAAGQVKAVVVLVVLGKTTFL